MTQESDLDDDPQRQRIAESEPLCPYDLSCADIHVWCSHVEDVRGRTPSHGYFDLMSDSERAQASRFRFVKDRRRYIVTRLLTRTVLSRCLNLPPSALAFGSNAYGRPELLQVSDSQLRIRFSISHSDELVFLAVTRDRAIGVDAEKIATPAPIEVAGRYFSPEELKQLHLLASEDQHGRFFELWTLKEAYIKARGMGLSIPLDLFNFHIGSDRDLAFETSTLLNDSASQWTFRQYCVRNSYLFSICAQKGAERSPRILTYESVPLHSESIVEWQLLRASR